MSKLKVSGNASGTGVITLEAPNTNTDRAITLPDSAGELINIAPSTSGNILTSDGTNWTSAAGGGKVLQVVSTTKTDTFTTTSTSFVDVTGLSVSITPSATTSKIMVIASYSIANTGSTYFTFARLVESSTAIFVGSSTGSRTPASARWGEPGASGMSSSTASILRSPNTTSAVTYKIQIMGESGATAVLNRTGSDSDTAERPRTASTITVMEIGA